MSAPREKFQSLLRELFQIESAADLDFGIYRIMGQKRAVIERFIDQELLAVIGSELKTGALRQEADASAQLEELAGQIGEILDDDALDAEGNLDPRFHQSKLGKQYLALQAKAAGARSAGNHEATIYNHLYHFFSRYYDQGDFMSLRRYSKREKYAIPYNGEEVHLHWANADQYYIKTGENFTDYRWKDPSGVVRVRFTVTAADVPKDNIKAPDKRYFLPQVDALVVEALGTGKDKDRHTLVTLPFHYRGLTAAETAAHEALAEESGIKNGNGNGNGGKLQAAILAAAAEALPKLPALKASRELLASLLAEHHRDADGNSVSRLAHHLRRFTVKNTSDYFIHKDLGGFLTRELDFYLKNEVLHLDTLEAGGEERAEGWFQMMRVIRALGAKIIAFLAQIENFQKRLFEKKKFVTECHYCLTLDRIPEELYPEIAKNREQIAEWKKLFSIHEVKGWTEQPSLSFLRKNLNLLIDTKHFSPDFIEGLVTSIDFDERTDLNFLVNADNIQALNLTSEFARSSLASVYLDPPYNTDAGPIIYKNGYRNSSWLSLIHDRLVLIKELLMPESILCITIDDYEAPNLRKLFSTCFPEFQLLGVAPIKNNPAGRTGTVGFSICHEYAFFYGRTEEAKVNRLEHSDEQKARYKEKDDIGSFEWTNFRKHGGQNTYQDKRPRQFYPIYVSGQKIRIPSMEWNNSKREWKILEEPDKGEEVLWPIDAKNRHRIWDFVASTARANVKQFKVKLDAQGNTAIYRKWRINDDGLLPQTWWDKSEYSAPEYGTNFLTNLFGEALSFSFPKSFHAVTDCLKVSGLRNNLDGWVADFFGGSGTTAHAVIRLNRDDGGNRSYLLSEMGKYFDSVLVGRIKRVAYGTDWKSGKPTTRDTGISHCFKYLRLESYEDALGNIAFDENEAAQRQLDFDEYVIHYMLAFETGGSETLLDIGKLCAPFDYKLEIRDGDESKFKNVDLPETFNFLIGLRVRTRKVAHRTKGRQKLKYLVLRGRTNPHATGGEREVVVIWRTTTGWKKEDFEADRDFIAKNGFTEGADEVFVNSDSIVKGARALDPVFKRRMFNLPDGAA